MCDRKCGVVDASGAARRREVRFFDEGQRLGCFRELIRPRGRLRHSVRSSKPGGWEPVAACHAAAAPRWATRRDTGAPTPNEIDQMSTSRQPTPRDAGFSGGSWWRLTRQSAVIPLRHAAAAAAPDANANISQRRRCTPNSFLLAHLETRATLTAIRSSPRQHRRTRPGARRLGAAVSYATAPRTRSRIRDGRPGVQCA